MSNKLIKGTLLGVVGISAVGSSYYGFIKPNLAESTQTGVATTNEVSSNQNSSSTSTSATTYKDGTYTGSVVSTRRGDFQVSVNVSGGKITNITMLTQPTEGRSQEINETTIPTYVEEAINTQSSNIKLVSGASETYTGFKNSLQNALNQAN